jgi:hypothetical protein
MFHGISPQWPHPASVTHSLASVVDVNIDQVYRKEEK